MSETKSKFKIRPEWIEAIEKEKDKIKMSKEELEELDKFIKLYVNKKSIASMSRSTGISEHFINKRIHNLGIK